MTERSEAYINGWNAHQLNQPGENNPYNEITQFYSYCQWNCGWCGRYSAVKHSEDYIATDYEFSMKALQ